MSTSVAKAITSRFRFCEGLLSFDASFVALAGSVGFPFVPARRRRSGSQKPRQGGPPAVAVPREGPTRWRRAGAEEKKGWQTATTTSTTADRGGSAISLCASHLCLN